MFYFIFSTIALIETGILKFWLDNKVAFWSEINTKLFAKLDELFPIIASSEEEERLLKTFLIQIARMQITWNPTTLEEVVVSFYLIYMVYANQIERNHNFFQSCW